MKPDDPALTDNQRELVRLLSIVLLDNDRPEALLVHALGSAGRDRLPTEASELLRFAELHLQPQLADEIGENLSLAFLRDLSAAIEPPDRTNAPVPDSKPASARGSSTQPSMSAVAPKADPPPVQAGRDEVVANRAPPKLRDSVAKLVRTASTKFRAAIVAAKAVAHPRSGRRPSILLVHSDRVVRAGFARALVNARFDVSVFDAVSELAPAAGGEETRVALLDISGAAAQSTLRSLIAADPALRVLAWTLLDATAAEQLLRDAGVGRFAVCPKTATPTEVVDSIRRLVRD